MIVMNPAEAGSEAVVGYRDETMYVLLIHALYERVSINDNPPGYQFRCTRPSCHAHREATYRRRALGHSYRGARDGSYHGLVA